MMKDPIVHPDPDQQLNPIDTGEHAHQRGHLKIFLGYAAGVGKTYAMLEAAHQRQGEKIDVVVGFVETHGQVETHQIMSGLEEIPRKLINYRDMQLNEMDLDGILTRNPDLVLVDGLAHTNVPGVRHPRRYQDVEELLAAGIDVYTTMPAASNSSTSW